MTGSIKNISLETFRGFLKHNGLNLIRSSGGHEVWAGKNLTRPVILQSHISHLYAHISPLITNHSSLMSGRLSQKGSLFLFFTQGHCPL